MKEKTRIYNVICIALFFLALPQSIEQIVTQFETNIRSIKSLQANFDHIYYDSSLSNPLKEKGVFYFQKPDFLKWEYNDPEKKIWLYKKGTFQFYIPEDKQLYRGSISEQEHEAEILMILSGQSHLLDTYNVEWGPLSSNEKKAWEIKFTPKKESEDYTHIILEISRKSLLIKRAVFFDWAGNKTEFQFSNIKTDLNLSEDIFKLEVPPDVEIIEEF